MFLYLDNNNIALPIWNKKPIWIDQNDSYNFLPHEPLKFQ